MALSVRKVSYKDKWIGKPYTSPKAAALILGGAPTLFISWNGVTEVKSWELYGCNE